MTNAGVVDELGNDPNCRLSILSHTRNDPFSHSSGLRQNGRKTKELSGVLNIAHFQVVTGCERVTSSRNTEDVLDKINANE